jgi:hypothetical protein
MDSAENRTRMPLQIDRGFESSRLEGQVIAAAYELVMPVIRCSLRPSASDSSTARSASTRKRTQQRPARRHA